MEYDKEQLIRVILVVERQHIIGFDLIRALKKKSYKAVFESDFKSAELFIKNESPDFIVAEVAAVNEFFKTKPELACDKMNAQFHFPSEENNIIVLNKELKILT